MIVAQAHIVDFEETSLTLFGSGFDDFWDALTKETLSFGKAVAYVHGDSHFYQDYIPDADGVPNLQALMVPGRKSVGWVEAVIDGDSSNVFSFTHIDVTPPEVDDSER
jgi:hypothetical protein